MALSQSSTCTQVSTLVHAELARPSSPKSVSAKADSLASSAVLRSTASPQTRSMAAAAAAAPASPSAVALKSLDEVDSSPDDELVRQISEDFDDPAEVVGMQVRRSSGKSSAARTSRRRALMMCLALGMVRPVTGSSGLHRSPSSGFTVKSGSLASQVSIASSLKAAKLLEDKDDESAPSTL